MLNCDDHKWPFLSTSEFHHFSEKLTIYLCHNCMATKHEYRDNNVLVRSVVVESAEDK